MRLWIPSQREQHACYKYPVVYTKADRWMAPHQLICDITVLRGNNGRQCASHQSHAPQQLMLSPRSTPPPLNNNDNLLLCDLFVSSHPIYLWALLFAFYIWRPPAAITPKYSCNMLGHCEVCRMRHRNLNFECLHRAVLKTVGHEQSVSQTVCDQYVLTHTLLILAIKSVKRLSAF